jgi:hypothetical protein
VTNDGEKTTGRHPSTLTLEQNISRDWAFVTLLYVIMDLMNKQTPEHLLNDCPLLTGRKEA